MVSTVSNGSSHGALSFEELCQHFDKALAAKKM